MKDAQATGLFRISLRVIRNQLVLLPAILMILHGQHAFSQQRTRVEILHSDRFDYTRMVGDEERKLVGNVAFRHNGALMYCDSAYQYVESNTVKAYGRIRVNQGDTIRLFGEVLDYNGNTRTGQIRQRVKLTDQDMTLTTDLIDFDLGLNISRYSTGGKIVDSVNTLTSRQGYYNSETKEFLFRENVKLTNPDYTILSDTMRYNTRSRIAYFQGPTQMASDSSSLYCEIGWYNTGSDRGEIKKSAWVEKGPNRLSGETIRYDRKRGEGEAFEKVEIRDTSRQITIRGDWGRYAEKPGKAIVAGNALMIQAEDGDSLFLHADTLRMDPDSLPEKKIIRAFYHARFFRNDFQGQCDSLSYNQSDSSFRLRGRPILWHESYQLSAKEMDLRTRNKKAEHLILREASFVISFLDSSLYNQISGKDLDGYFEDGSLKRIIIQGNGETIYYPEDKDKLIGHNAVVCSNISIELKEGKVKRIRFLTQPDARLTPLSQVKSDQKFLKGFSWKEADRPNSPTDVFRWPQDSGH